MKIDDNITNVTIQKIITGNSACRYINKFLYKNMVLGLACIRKTAKQLIPHQLINLFLNLIFVKHKSNDNAPIIVVGQI